MQGTKINRDTILENLRAEIAAGRPDYRERRGRGTDRPDRRPRGHRPDRRL